MEEWEYFVKKPVKVQAKQWFNYSDIPHIVKSYLEIDQKKIGKSDKVCNNCGLEMCKHGFVETFEGLHIVCPGDWIVKGIKGKYYPVKPDIFYATYEKVKK